MDPIDLANLRTEYSREILDENSVSPDPFVQFGHWMKEALDCELLEPSAMNLATVDAEGKPSSRMVLLKGFDHTGFTFYTNYESQKGRHLAGNVNCALHFFWASLERQIRIEGRAEKISREESEAYFASRPLESRVGAWASGQSSVLASRAELERRFDELLTEFKGRDIPLPAAWGGYRVVPQTFEFWQGRPSRLHDRIRYSNADGRWVISRLSP